MKPRASTVRIVVGTVLVSILASVAGVLLQRWLGGHWARPVATAVIGSVVASVIVLVLSPRWGRAASQPPCRPGGPTKPGSG